jgi:hypothetical protein
MHRARELIEPYLEMSGLVGAYLVGSATRPYRDAHSDLDIEIVVEDEVYEGLPDAEQHVFVIDEGPPRRLDHEFYLRPRREMEELIASDLDLFHFAYQHAVILHDPSGDIARWVTRLRELPASVREDRLRVHYLELLDGAARTRRTLERGGDPLDVQLVAGAMARALTRLLFVQQGSWAPTRHWTGPELRLLGTPPPLLDRLREALADPAAGPLTELVQAVDAHLTAAGETFHQDHRDLMRWAYLTDPGKHACARWSAR